MMNYRMMNYRVRLFITRCVILAVIAAFLWMLIAVIGLEADHITMCNAVARTAFAIPQNWGC